MLNLHCGLIYLFKKHYLKLLVKMALKIIIQIPNKFDQNESIENSDKLLIRYSSKGKLIDKYFNQD